jgi:hypothetical protein
MTNRPSSGTALSSILKPRPSLWGKAAPILVHRLPVLPLLSNSSTVKTLRWVGVCVGVGAAGDVKSNSGTCEWAGNNWRMHRDLRWKARGGALVYNARLGYKTLVAIANKHVRIIWILAHQRRGPTIA